MKVLYVMIGIPCVGKTSMIKKNLMGSYYSVSHDHAVTMTCYDNGLTYRDFFTVKGNVRKLLNKEKNALFNKMIDYANETDQDVYIDMTMMTKKSRELMKSKITNRDKVVYLVFETSKEDIDFLAEQSKKRDSELSDLNKKGIHKGILINMQSNYQKPEENEADEIHYITPWWKRK